MLMHNRKPEGFKTAAVWGFAILALVSGLALAGCGDKDSGDPTKPTDPTGSTGKTLVSIEITTQPTKTTYTVGDSALETAGMVVTATYSDGSTAAVTGYTTSGFNSNVATTNQITVSYKEGEVTQTATFTIKVEAASTIPADLKSTRWQLSSSSSSGGYFIINFGAANKYTEMVSSGSTIETVASFTTATNTTASTKDEYPSGYCLTLSGNTKKYYFLNADKTKFVRGSTENNATSIFTKQQ